MHVEMDKKIISFTVWTLKFSVVLTSHLADQNFHINFLDLPLSGTEYKGGGVPFPQTTPQEDQQPLLPANQSDFT
jgi:hypothetical protein